MRKSETYFGTPYFTVCTFMLRLTIVLHLGCMKVRQIRWFKKDSRKLEANILSCFSCKDKKCTSFFLRDIEFGKAIAFQNMPHLMNVIRSVIKMNFS